MKKLCCIFNYPPLYRKSIYLKIDESFNTTFYFGDEVIDGQVSGIKKLNYSLFKNTPVTIKNKLLFGKYLWRTGILHLPFKRFSSFIITGDMPLSYFPFLFLCKLLGKKVYAWGHGFKTLNGRFRHITIMYLNMLDGFFVYGEKGKQRMIELGFSESKFHVIYNSLSDGVNIDANSSLKNSIYMEYFHNDNSVIIFVGRLTKSKRLDWLLKAVSELRDEGQIYNLVLVGDGEAKDELKRISVELSIVSSVWFYGECYAEEYLKYLIYNADLCVSPGNVGLTAIHCMEYGVPVITHNKFELQGPEYETIKDGCTGLLYQYGSFDDLKEKIKVWFIGNYKREAIRQNCYDVINEKFNSDYQIEVIKKVVR